jgi:hypothetical protein
MSDKKTYWIADAEGVKARITGADDLAQWTRVHGWTETTEPTGMEFQWVRNETHGGKGVMNHAAALLHEGLGWFPSGPDGYDEPAAEAPPAKSSAPKSATSGDKKE